VTFKDEKDGTEQTVRVAIGKSLLEAAHENEIELEGACEGSLACSTCHVIVEDQVGAAWALDAGCWGAFDVICAQHTLCSQFLPAASLHPPPLSCSASPPPTCTATQDYYDKLPEPDDDENDMLDLAFGLTDT
jgi:ferredoxin